MADGPEDSELELEPKPPLGGLRRRGIYLLPNLFTTGVLFSGFFAIVQAMNGMFDRAAIAVYVAMVLDGMDGRVARWTHTQSEFGAQYDSIADMVAFGAAPALIAYTWALKDLGTLGWIGAFIYCGGAGIRLARFNANITVVDKRYFQGLPSPAAAGVVAGAVWCGLNFDVPGSAMIIPAYILTVGAGALMVSSIGFYSFKDLKLQGKVPFTVLLAVPVLLIIIYLSPPNILFLSFLLYALFGIAMAMWRLRKRLQHRKPA